MANFHNKSSSQPTGQPYYDPQRGFVYLQPNVTSAPDMNQDDDANLDEIERELYGADQQIGAGYDELSPNSSSQHLMAQLEAEITEEQNRVYSQSHVSNDRYILQQTWFPESRNCINCQGFKYAAQFGSGQCPDCAPATKANVVEEGDPSKR